MMGKPIEDGGGFAVLVDVCQVNRTGPDGSHQG